MLIHRVVDYSVAEESAVSVVEIESWVGCFWLRLWLALNFVFRWCQVVNENALWR